MIKIYMQTAVCLSLLSVVGLKAFEQKQYQFSRDLIDVVIPCHKKDFNTLSYVIQGIKTYIPHRRIIIVSREGLPDQRVRLRSPLGRVTVVSGQKLSDHVEWFDEQKYPFSKEDIAYEIFQNKELANQYISHPNSRLGWIYQQLLKLYAPFVIPDISENVLIVDADTIFLRKVAFQDATGAPLFNVGREYIVSYFNCMDRLIPGLKKVYANYSGICHHMLFQKPVLEDLMGMIEDIHGESAWKAICHAIDHEDLYKSGFSEYELYFNFIFSRSKQPKIRLLKWRDMSLKLFANSDKRGLDYVSCHSWI